MLRKVSHIILASLLLISTMGLAISKHYCSGSFVSVSVFHEAKSCCGDSDCCHNEDLLFKVSDDFSTPQIIHNPELAELDIYGLELLVIDLNINPQTETTQILYNNSPPPPTIQKSLSLKQVYRL